jgi:hypothetical protein
MPLPSPSPAASPLAPVSSSAGANPPSAPSPEVATPSTDWVTSAVPVGSIDLNRTVHVPGAPKSMGLA